MDDQEHQERKDLQDTQEEMENQDLTWPLDQLVTTVTTEQMEHPVKMDFPEEMDLTG